MAHRPMPVVAVRIMMVLRARRKPITTKRIATAVAASRVGAVSVHFFRVHVQVLFLSVQLVVVSVKGFIVEGELYE